MRTDVTFSSAGLRLAGHLYTPDDEFDGPRAAIVVSHPASGLKEQAAGLYAERLADAGFVTLTFDSAFQGESEGEPRGLEDPAHRVEDIKAGVSFLSVHDAVDTERIGALGICASGGYVIPASVTDHRVKAVATVSAADLGRQFREGGDGQQDRAVIRGMLDQAAAARTAEARGEPTGTFAIFPDSEETARAGLSSQNGASPGSVGTSSRAGSTTAPTGRTTRARPRHSHGPAWIASRTSMRSGSSPSSRRARCS
jgi:hypothetical protein